MKPQCVISGCTRPRKHRDWCGAHYQAMWKAGTLPPRKRPITYVCPPNHRHGEVLTCYNHHGCRCDDCYENRHADNDARARRVAYGRPLDSFVDAEPVREHIFELAQAGIGKVRLAELSGVSVNAIRALKGLRRGKPVAKVRKETAAAILAVTTDVKRAPRMAVDSRGAVRRLQALIARGWTGRALNDELGLLGHNLATWFAQETMTQEKVDQIAALYERLWDQSPPIQSGYMAAASRRAINRARREGWPPPLAWDDIDDPNEQPDLRAAHTPKTDVDEAVVLRVMAGERLPMTTGERREVVARLRARGWSLNEIETHTGIGKPERYVGEDAA